MFREVHADDLPWVTTDQMREIDRVMVEDLGIELIQMMENAGRALTDVAIQRFSPIAVTVLAGTGGNGGGAMVAARHLANRGVDVSVAVTDPGRLGLVIDHQYQILQRMGVSIVDAPISADLVVDGVIGYSLQGAPRGRAEGFISWCSGKTVVSLDVPSGLEATTGDRLGAYVQPAATVTLAAPKTGLRSVDAVGDLYLADISVPPAVFDDLGFDSVAGLNQGSVVLVRGMP